jgi:transketolase
MTLELRPRRARYVDIAAELAAEHPDGGPLGEEDLLAFGAFDRLYRALCALLYNYAPTSGHPGGSISSGRIAAGLLFGAMDYDLAAPDRDDADQLVYAAGHKAMGLYALWALRDEVARLAAPELLPVAERQRLRLEDLLGFRRNPVSGTPLLARHRAKPLDGHPTPATPFVRIATGASWVGVAAGLGLALGAQDWFGEGAPRVHLLEGEGGLTPGRVAEALAAGGTLPLANAVLHVDWNQSSIDSDRVCAEGDEPGDYVQWNPLELAYLHDWNVVWVPDGFDLQQIAAAQQRALGFDNGQPTAVVYRTRKGWQYGIEGRASHGAGHALCSEAFYQALAPLTDLLDVTLPTCEAGASRCGKGRDAAVVEECFWESLMLVRAAVARNPALFGPLAHRLRDARYRLDALGRRPRPGAPRVDEIFAAAQAAQVAAPPPGLTLAPGALTTLRGELGRVLDHFNRVSDGAILGAAADLLGSTSASTLAAGFPGGFYHASRNPDGRLLTVGGICEDAICGLLSGLSAFGRHLGVGSSYGAFIAPLGHIAARLHAIGGQARQVVSGDPYAPFFLVCAHAGLKTGEDGPTHADPQALQLLSGNFPPGTLITLTPWDPQELWPLVSAALAARPAVIAPFVTRPNERVLDRASFGLAPAAEAALGVYALRRPEGAGDGVVVLQESGVAYAFIEEALPILERQGVDLHVYYIASAELFDLLPAEQQERIFPAAHAAAALGITGFTLPTLYRWVTSPAGRAASLHPFLRGHFLGSGAAHLVLEEAGLDGASQAAAVLAHLGARRRAGASTLGLR